MLARFISSWNLHVFCGLLNSYMMFVAPYVDVGRNVAKASKMNDGMEILIFPHICSCVVCFHMATA